VKGKNIAESAQTDPSINKKRGKHESLMRRPGVGEVKKQLKQMNDKKKGRAASKGEGNPSKGEKTIFC